MECFISLGEQLLENKRFLHVMSGALFANLPISLRKMLFEVRNCYPRKILEIIIWENKMQTYLELIYYIIERKL